jgi:L-asparaginase II
MVEPFRVAIRRGGVVESVQLVHAVAWQDGSVVASAGDPELVTFFRSSAKPLQALPLLRSRDDLEEAEIAIACASHRADPAQIDAVRSLLAKAPATEDDLECGPQEGRPPGRIFHNCSGKHAGMLAACRARGWETRDYRLAGHPLQQEIHGEIAAAAGAEPQLAVDGCGVPTFAFTLAAMARAFAAIPELDRGAQALAAMRGRPELVGGAGALDTELMRAHDGWAAKGGAEGLLCATGPGGLGVILKVADGNQRALPPAVAAFLANLGRPWPEYERVPVLNSRGEEVGEVTVG